MTQMHNSQFNKPVQSVRVSRSFPPKLFMQRIIILFSLGVVLIDPFYTSLLEVKEDHCIIITSGGILGQVTI